MTAQEKIKVFRSVDDLLSEIEKDRLSTSILSRRYAVRFMMLDNFNRYREMVGRLITCGIKSFDIETLLSNDKDRWVTQDELKTAIKSIKESSLISPFSEIARFYDDMKFNSFFNEISLLENPRENLSRRLYIPLIGLQNRFEDFLNTFARIAESAPVWSIVSDEPQKVRLFLTENDRIIDTNSGLKTLYDWLRFWKTQAPVEKIVCSSLPVIVNAKHSEPDNIFTPIHIDSTYDFIDKFHGISLNIPYVKTEENFWQEILPHVKNSYFDYNQFVRRHFNIISLSIKDIIGRWMDSDSSDFDRWLLKHYYLQNLAEENKYLADILENCEEYSPQKLFRKIILSIFTHNNGEYFAQERTALLNMFERQHDMSESDLSTIREHLYNIAETDIKQAFSLCTGRFDFEKVLFLEWYQSEAISLDELRNVYPDFVAYMEDSKHEKCWTHKYIRLYKQAKTKDKYTNEIGNLIAEKNANEDSFYEWYHGFESSKELLAKTKVDKVFWIDGLGIEYLSLITHIIAKSGFKIEQLHIAKTNIPSSTDHNRFESAVRIGDLDKYIHDEPYRYPDSVCSEIDIINGTFDKILNQSAEMTLAIVSDHGLTALSRLVESKKYSAKASHEGRYIKCDSNDCLPDPDYVICKNGNEQFKVALTHASLGRKPIREVHGGCTPEEVLVPFIVISNKKDEDIATPALNATPIMAKEIKSKPTGGFEEEDLF